MLIDNSIQEPIRVALNNGFEPFNGGINFKYTKTNDSRSGRTLIHFEWDQKDWTFRDSGFIEFERLIFSTNFIEKLTGKHDRCENCGKDPMKINSNYSIGKNCNPVYRTNSHGGHYSCCQGASFVSGAYQIRKELANMSREERILYINNIINNGDQDAKTK